MKYLLLVVLSFGLYGFDFIDDLVETSGNYYDKAVDAGKNSYEKAKTATKEKIKQWEIEAKEYEDISNATKTVYVSNRLFPVTMDKNMKSFGLDVDQFCTILLVSGYVVADKNSHEHVKNAVTDLNILKIRSQKLALFDEVAWLDKKITDDNSDPYKKYYEKIVNEGVQSLLYDGLEKANNEEEKIKTLSTWLQILNMNFENQEPSGLSTEKSYQLYECHENDSLEEFS